MAELPFALRSKSNFRRGGRSASSTWTSLAGFEKSVALLMAASRPVEWVVPDPVSSLADRPVSVSVVVAASLLDVGNFHKSLLDACEGVLFVSDAEVRATVALGERARSGQRASVGFAQLSPRASLEDLAVAVQALTRVCLERFPAPMQES